MTNNIKPDRDTIAHALRNIPLGPAAFAGQVRLEIADAVLAVLPGRTEAQVKAEAWAEGYTSGRSRAMRCMSDEPNVPHATNPYE